MKNMKILFTLILLMIPSFALGAEEVEIGQVVVTATRTEAAIKSIPSSVTVITANEIEKQQVRYVNEVLREVPGLDVVQSGGPGRNTSIFIRGSNSGHLLVMIDGVQVNSPTTGSYDFANLTVDNIERIEVVRGPQSTLYGSDAMAGVINIITKKGTGKPAFTIKAEGGSYDTKKGNVAVRGGNKKLDYSLAFSMIDSDGFSAASEANGNTEEDGYENKTLSAKMGYQISENINVGLTARRFDAEAEIDGGSSGLGVDDPNYTMETDSTTIAAKLKHTVGEMWDHTIKASLTTEKFKLVEGDPDPFNWYNSNIDTKIKTLDWQNNFYLLDEAHTITVGAEYEKAEAENESAALDHSVSNKAIYLQDKISAIDSKLNLLAGMRYDDHKKFGSETTYKVAVSYLIDKTGTTLRSSYGKAFKAPTLNDLYYNNPAVGRGNPNLEPEKSKGYDLGIEQELIDKHVIFSATYFKNDFKNLIEWVEYAPWLYEPQNVAEANTKGWEFDLEVKAVENLIIGASFTRTDTEDEAKKRQLIRRPEKK
ncbi:MAG: TonB-dependent receptor, partial [Proteobacteria bacterium]|nr:TonB-dependent receptor [Pseudomonadota bacterium]